MPIYRDADGRIEKASRTEEPATRRIKKDEEEAISKRVKHAVETAPKTMLLRGNKPRAESAAPAPTHEPEPTVGWLVVMEGPGRGASFPLGYGPNGIGRDTDQAVSLDFGDSNISRGEHAVVTYDGRGRKFYVQHGGGKNLTYMGDAPVLAPTEIQDGAEITIGETTLRFVAFCGAAFNWEVE